MILAAHQPAFMPWLGYLDKMNKCDVFVVMDDLQYEAQNFQNRNRVKLNNGAQWLTVPLKKGSQNDRIIDKMVQNDAKPEEHWQRRMWQTLKTHYGRAPFFNRYAEELEGMFTTTWTHLVDLDLRMLELARQWFGINRPILRSSTLNLQGQKTDRIVDMCQKLGAKAYLSGKGGSSTYLETEKFAAIGSRVIWQHYVHPQYPQRYPQLGFVPYLGFLDLLLNCGPDSSVIAFASEQTSERIHGGSL